MNSLRCPGPHPGFGPVVGPESGVVPDLDQDQEPGFGPVSGLNPDQGPNSSLGSSQGLHLNPGPCSRCNCCSNKSQKKLPLISYLKKKQKKTLPLNEQKNR